MKSKNDKTGKFSIKWAKKGVKPLEIVFSLHFGIYYAKIK